MIERRAKRKRDWVYAKEAGRWEGTAKIKLQSITDRWKAINSESRGRKQVADKATASAHQQSVKGLGEPQKNKVTKQKENTVQERGKSGCRILKRRKLGVARPGNVPLAERNLSSKLAPFKRRVGASHKG